MQGTRMASAFCPPLCAQPAGLAQGVAHAGLPYAIMPGERQLYIFAKGREPLCRSDRMPFEYSIARIARPAYDRIT